MGVWLGGLFTLSRALLLTLTPSAHVGQAFSIYTVMERFATFVGPLVWGGVLVSVTSDYGTNYKAAAVAMSAMLCAAFYCMLRVPQDISK
jgi:MFS-type transporter involved in bile tolerance (Atg22 family)